MAQIMKMLKRMQAKMEENERKIDLTAMQSEIVPRNPKGAIVRSLVVKNKKMME